MTAAVLTLANGDRHAVLGGALLLPKRGVWQARLELDADEALVSSTVELALARDDGGAPQIYRGAIARAGYFEGRARAIVVGGLGGLVGELAAPLLPRTYDAAPHPPSAALLIADVVADAGEQLAPGVAAALEALVLPRWLRARAFGAATLSLLADRLGLEWRMRPDGLVWVGVETWPAAPDVAGLYQLGDDGFATALDAAPEAVTIVPGMVVQGRRICEAVYKLGTALRVELYTAESLSETWAAATGRTGPPPAYERAHAATVRARRADDSVDVEVDGEDLGTVNAVPVRLGLRGRVLLEDGDRVRVRFEEADPARPYVGELERDAGADKPVAFQGSSVTFPWATVPGPVVGTFVLVPGVPGQPNGLLGTVANGCGHNLVRGS